MLEEVNTIAGQYRDLIGVITALATVAAVITSLWIVLSERKLKVTAHISSSIVGSADADGIMRPEKFPTIITLSISNMEPYSIYIPFLSLISVSIPFSRRTALLNPLTDYSSERDLEVKQGKSVNLLLIDMNTFKSIVNDSGNNWDPILKKWRIRHMAMNVSLSDGRMVQAQLGKSLRELVVRIQTKKE